MVQNSPKTAIQKIKNGLKMVQNSPKTAIQKIKKWQTGSDPENGKLYVFPIESAFEYLHQLNRKESS